MADAVSIARGQVEKRKLAVVLRSQQSQALTDEDYELAEQLHQQLEETKLTQEHHITATALEAVSVCVCMCVCVWVCMYVCGCACMCVVCVGACKPLSQLVIRTP